MVCTMDSARGVSLVREVEGLVVEDLAAVFAWREDWVSVGVAWARTMRAGRRASSSPSPQPSPSGRGSSFGRVLETSAIWASSTLSGCPARRTLEVVGASASYEDDLRFSLSLRERAGVREKESRLPFNA